MRIEESFSNYAGRERQPQGIVATRGGGRWDAPLWERQPQGIVATRGGGRWNAPLWERQPQGIVATRSCPVDLHSYKLDGM